MSKKKLNNNGIVYSTNPDFHFEEAQQYTNTNTLPPPEQKLIVKTETKHRAGKVVTLITGFVGSAEDLGVLAKFLKTHCGTGGSAKDGEIIIQGNYTEKIKFLLQSKGYKMQ